MKRRSTQNITLVALEGVLELSPPDVALARLCGAVFSQVLGRAVVRCTTLAMSAAVKANSLFADLTPLLPWIQHRVEVIR